MRAKSGGLSAMRIHPIRTGELPANSVPPAPRRFYDPQRAAWLRCGPPAQPAAGMLRTCDSGRARPFCAQDRSRDRAHGASSDRRGGPPAVSLRDCPAMQHRPLAPSRRAAPLKCSVGRSSRTWAAGPAASGIRIVSGSTYSRRRRARLNGSRPPTPTSTSTFAQGSFHRDRDARSKL